MDLVLVLQGCPRRVNGDCARMESLATSDLGNAVGQLDKFFPALAELDLVIGRLFPAALQFCNSRRSVRTRRIKRAGSP